MKLLGPRRHAVVLLLALGMIASGCARKATETPPTTPTPPPSQPTEPTPPPTPPSDTTSVPEPGGRITSSDLQPAFFDYDSYALRDDARSALDRNARTLRDNSGTNITIEGHCDERGTVEYNQALGERRAQSAREYLVAAGIDGGRIQVISYGKERPFATGSDESAWSQNRRAHFVVR
jgi:peptidoglycan-associated lipoprotein